MSKTKFAAAARRLPTYRLHKASGQGIVTLPDGLGGRKDFLLGKHGSPESRRRYLRLLARWEAMGHCLSQPRRNLRVEDLIHRFWGHAEEHYKSPDGKPTAELRDYRLSLRPLRFLFGTRAARRFGPLDLRAVRNLMIAGYQHPKYGIQPPLSRRVINQRIGRIRRLFRWAAENELVSARIWHALQSVRGLVRHRSAARDIEPVRPVAPEIVDQTLPFLLPTVADMVRVQLLTGMRPGELVAMRCGDIERNGDVWLYRPRRHKTEHHGHQRNIALGPRAQAILEPYLGGGAAAFVFSPRAAREAQDVARRGRRKSKLSPSQLRRCRKRKPRRSPGEHYTVASYGRAIARACLRADHEMHRQNAELVGQRVIPHWHPHQLRHTRATQLRQEAGLEIARVILGHRSPTITETYAEIDETKAVQVMARLG